MIQNIKEVVDDVFAPEILSPAQRANYNRLLFL